MYNLACSYAQMQKLDEAIEWLEKAEAAGMEVGNHAMGDSDLDPLRRDPRFKKMRDRWEQEMEAGWRHNGFDFNHKDEHKDKDKNKGEGE